MNGFGKLLTNGSGDADAKFSRHDMLRQLLRPRVLIAALLALLPFVFFYPAVLGQVLLAPSDGWHQNFGVRVLVGRMLAHGQLPLWNPFIFAGTPLAASVYPGAFYPPNWLFALLPAGAAMNLVVITTFHLALVGAYLYARRIGLARIASLVTGLIFAFGGFMIAHISHTSRIAAAAWLPFVLLAIEKLCQSARWRWVVLGSLFVALQFFAGEPQMLVLTALVTGAYAAFRFFGIKLRPQKFRFAMYCAAFALVGALFACLQLLPARELHAQSGRAVSTYEYFSAYALPPRQLFALVFPYFFGGAVGGPYHTTPFATSFWGPWEINLATGYVGLTGLLLAVLAVICMRGKQDQSFVTFWACVALVAVLLALGPALPFDINRLLHRIPVYNVFRGLYRHLYEFNFAVAVLAGWAVNELGKARISARRLAVGTGLIAALVALTATAYLVFARSWVRTKAPLAPSLTLKDAEAWVPLLMFVAAAAAVWFYARRPRRAAAAVLLSVLFVDLFSFGGFYVWRSVKAEKLKLMGDPPAVALIKSRERDAASFRLVTRALDPAGERYETLNYPNLSIVRGLQSVSGFDALRIQRLADLSGDQTEAGFILDGEAFGPQHCGYDLLGVKYLLREPSAVIEPYRALVYDGVSFAAMNPGFNFGPGSRHALTIKKTPATEIAFVTALANSGQIADGTPVLRVRLRTADGRVIERELQAGRDTAEWAYDRPDVRASAKHRRARVVESFPLGPAAPGVEGHRYLARLAFEPTEIVGVECEYLPTEAGLLVARASLYDARSAVSTELDLANVVPDRWRKLAEYEGVEVYENVRARPRAWLVGDVVVRPSAEVLGAVKTGRLSDGAAFDPARTALLEREDFGGRAVTPPPTGEVTNAAIKVTRYEPQRIELETQNAQAALLVVSEVYYRGWEARVDGERAAVLRADYALRGVAVPGGKHRVEFYYRAPSLRAGAICAGAGLLLLLMGGIVARQTLRASGQA